jgi:hypothetical protein
MDRYAGNDTDGKPKSAYLKKISRLKKEDLILETRNQIWLSTYDSNKPRSDFHWHVDALYEEIQKRYGNSALYNECYQKVIAAHT